MAHILREHGFHAFVIHGGLRAWTKAGYPVEPVPSDDLVLLPTFSRRREVSMPASMDDLKQRLAHTRQIKISVIGRKTGATISLPVWFVLEGDTLHLLPVSGSDTQWFKNLERNRFLGIVSGAVEASFKSRLIRDPATVKSVVQRFRHKYGAADVKKYYSKFDVAVGIKLSQPGSAAA